MSNKFTYLKDVPKLLNELYPTLNNDIDITKIKVTSKKLLWWQCPKNKDHIWLASPLKRYYHNSGCHFCTSKKINHTNSLRNINPILAQEWHPTKNGIISPDNVAPRSKRKVWWICKNGHEWQAQIDSRSSRGCPYCVKKFTTTEYNFAILYPKFLLEWDYEKNDISPDKIHPSSQRKVHWKCKKGHSWKATVANRTCNESGCPECHTKSKVENKIRDYLEQLKINFTREKRFALCKDKKTLPFDFALIIHNKLLIIEYHGEQHYKHTRRIDAINYFERTRRHDRTKEKFCKDNNIPLLIIPYTKQKQIEILINNFIDKNIY